uniref:Uncharacterized protein n=1 Tax=Oryza punctata TaxID=4537 RepID=A0A0E0LSL2_ORYPU
MFRGDKLQPHLPHQHHREEWQGHRQPGQPQKPPLSEHKEFAVCSVAEWNSHQRQVFSVFFTVVQRLHADLGEDGGELQPAELLSGKPVQILPSPR